MEAENRAGVLEVLSDLQADGCASIEVSIGGTTDGDMVEHDALYITKAPAKVITYLSDMGYSLSVTDDGVRVEDYKR